MSGERAHLVHLTDPELVLLDGRCSEKAQAEVDAAKHRLATRRDDLTVPQSDLIAATLDMVAKEGKLYWTRKPLTDCSICGRRSDYRRFKSGQRKGEPNYKAGRITFAGIDMDPSFVTIQHSARLGGCGECMTAMEPHIVAALAGVPVDAPENLSSGQRWRKRGNRRCRKCEWTGHEGEMTQERTLMSDGWFPSKCPECGAGGVFSRDVDHVDGFVLVPLPSDGAR